MTFPFDPSAGAILVEAELTGPLGNTPLVLFLDKGATCSLVSEARLRFVGCDPAQATEAVQATFGGGVQTLPVVVAVGFRALGVARADYKVVCHTLPPSAGVDGVLGLDFSRAMS
jgi:Aspartyl protease